MVKNKRKLKRRHLILYLRVFDNQNNELLGYLVDITTNGIMLMSEQPIVVGKQFNLKVLIESFDNKQTYLHFQAESRWSQRCVNSDFYDTGLELQDISEDYFSEIRQIINELGFTD